MPSTAVELDMTRKLQELSDRTGQSIETPILLFISAPAIISSALSSRIHLVTEPGAVANYHLILVHCEVGRWRNSIVSEKRFQDREMLTALGQRKLRIFEYVKCNETIVVLKLLGESSPLSSSLVLVVFFKPLKI